MIVLAPPLSSSCLSQPSQIFEQEIKHGIVSQVIPMTRTWQAPPCVSDLTSPAGTSRLCPALRLDELNMFSSNCYYSRNLDSALQVTLVPVHAKIYNARISRFAAKSNVLLALLLQHHSPPTMPQNEYIERFQKQHGRRLDYEERVRKRTARESHKVSKDSQHLTGLRAKL